MAELTFTDEELEQIEQIKSKYPTNKSATLPVLWLAQQKYGHVKPEVQELVARTLDLPESHVHGVATFYTQYYKEEKGKFVLDVCTCLSCQLCGAYDMLEYLEDKLDIHAGQTTEDGKFTIREAECLGACGYAPMMQVTNDVYVNHLTREKIDELLENMKQGKWPEYEQIELPQHESTNE